MTMEKEMEDCHDICLKVYDEVGEVITKNQQIAQEKGLHDGFVLSGILGKLAMISALLIDPKDNRFTYAQEFHLKGIFLETFKDILNMKVRKKDDMTSKIETPIIEVKPNEMCNNRYGVLVWKYLFGELRIQLSDKESRNGQYGPHGGIIQEISTLNNRLVKHLVGIFKNIEDPPSLCSLLKRTHRHNEGGRILLDEPIGSKQNEEETDAEN